MTLRSAFLSASVLVLLSGCSSNNGGSAPADAGQGGSTLDASSPDATTGGEDSGSSDAASADAGTNGGTPATFNVYDHIPQFNMYSSTEPTDYTPPSGTLMWSYGTIFVTQLDAAQQSQLGSDLAARVTYYAQCDNYDRIGGVFFLVEPKGQAPQPTDPRIELVRFITPFSDYSEGALATHVYPNADLSAFANVLADQTHDIWIGIGGGSYPTYTGNPCTGLKVDAGSDYLEIGFSYSLDFVSTKPLGSGATMVLPAFSIPPPPPSDDGGADAGDGGEDGGAVVDAGPYDAGPPVAISNIPLTATPIQGTFTNPGASISGHVTVIVSGHGSAQGGDEYENTEDMVSAAGEADAGSFSTAVDCSSYASASPDGNPGIFQDNNLGNPRNWCPGATVTSHTFPLTLPAGTSNVTLAITPSQVPSGSYYQTSITFTSP